MSRARSGSQAWEHQRWNAILKTAIPASAARSAAGPVTPRPRSAPASALTRELLGWQPVQPGLIDDLDEGHYFAGPAA